MSQIVSVKENALIVQLNPSSEDEYLIVQQSVLLNETFV